MSISIKKHEEPFRQIPLIYYMHPKTSMPTRATSLSVGGSKITKDRKILKELINYFDDKVNKK